MVFISFASVSYTQNLQIDEHSQIGEDKYQHPGNLEISG